MNWLSLLFLAIIVLIINMLALLGQLLFGLDPSGELVVLYSFAFGLLWSVKIR